MLNHRLLDKINNSLITVIYLMICIVLPNVVSYFIWSSTYVVVLWLKNNSWEKTVIYGFWPLSVYYVGQLYSFLVISPEELNHPLYPDGRSIYFKFTPLMAFGVAVLVSWLVRWWHYRRVGWLVVVLILLAGSNIYSSMVNGSVMADWMVLANFWSGLATVVWLWWSICFVKELSREQKSEFWDYWLLVLKWCLITGSMIVLVQLVKKSTLGLVVEQTQVIPYFGAGSDELSWWIRPVGISGHANGMAMIILSELLAWVWLRLKVKKTVWQSWLLLPIVAEIVLQSRTSLLGFGALVCWWWFFEGKYKYGRLEVVKFSNWQKLVSVLLIAMTAIVGVNRGLATILETSNNSGWATRNQLVVVSWQLVRNSPWWGIGPGNFIARAFREDMAGNFRMFPEPVHNGFMLILAEQGLIGFGLSIFFMGGLIRKWWIKTEGSLSWRWLLVVSVVSQMAWMLLQPINDLLPVWLLMCVLLLTDD